MKAIHATLAASLLVGCGQEEQSPGPTDDSEARPHLLETQVEALEEAKQLEQALQDAAAKRLQDVDQNQSDHDG